MDPISRRQFIQRGAAVTAASTISPMIASRAAWALPSNVPIGLQLYSVGDDLQKDVPGTLKRLRAIGYSRVETAGFAGLTAKEFRSQLDAADLMCHSVHLTASEGDMNPLFEDAHTVGAHYVVTSGLGKTATLDDYKVMADRINDLAGKAKQAGLQYAYHNHNFEFRALEGGGIGYDVLLKQTDPKLVDFELDCGWIVAAGYSPETYFQRYPHRYVMLHIKDFVAGSGPITSLAKNERPQGTELGHGHIDYRPILAAAAKAGIHDYYVEQEPPFLDMKPLEAVKVDYDYLRGI